MCPHDPPHAVHLRVGLRVRCSHFHNGYEASGEQCSNCAIQQSDFDDNNVGRVQTCDLGGLPDLDTGNAHVQQVLTLLWLQSSAAERSAAAAAPAPVPQVQAELLNRLSSMGVAGVRMDATKHVNVDDVIAMWKQVRGLYANMEIIQSGDGLPFGRDYDAIGSPWEFKVGCPSGRRMRAMPYSRRHPLVLALMPCMHARPCRCPLCMQTPSCGSRT